MRGRIAILFSVVAFGLAAPLLAQTDEEVEAHKLVLDLTGAFSNDGFKLRDGHWTGTIKPQERALIAVNLYAGNQYWFSAAANTKAKKISVDVYDETGKPMVVETFNEGGRASAGFSPTTSGQYFVSLGLLEGEATAFCLVYSYK
ncbi:MAG: hypothetical protein DMF06_01530 [Verrucomicrobia bacterium]|nr:MAG: hypothetical protein DMF06_01530 [Verrucomicrobiota bacterium]